MKKKYYMRGLGFGILITTLVFTFLNQTKISDADVIKRAKELGYVKEDTASTPGIDLEGLKAKDTPVPTGEGQGQDTTPAPTSTGTPDNTPTPASTPESVYCPVYRSM